MRMLFKFSAYGFLKNLRFFEPFLYLFFLENGLSFFQIGILISVREIFVNLFEIPTGVIADLTGRRRAMVLSFSSYLISFTVFYVFSGFVLFLPAMILFAAGEAFRSGTHKSMILEYLDLEGRSDEQVSYYGKTRSASRLGSALSALLAALIVYFRGNYNVVFLFTMVPYSLDLLLMLTYPRELDGSLESGRSFVVRVKEQLGKSYNALRDTEELSKILANASIFDAVFKIGKDYLQPVLKAQALSLPLLLFISDKQARTAILVGIVYFFIYLNSFVSSRSSSSFMDRVGDLPRGLNAILWIDVFALLGAGLFLELDIGFLAVLAVFVLYTLYNLRKPMVVGFLARRMESQQRATLLSTHSQLRSVVGIVIAPIFGLLADNLGVASTFLFAGSLMVATGILLRITGSKTRG